MSEFLDRISRLSPQRLALLADELNARLQAAESARKVPLAIVGIGCRLPGGVRDADSFWALLHDGVDAIRTVPASRWNVEEFYDPTPDARGKMDTRWGGFIDGHDEFDPKFFGIAPSEAETMDPQQRLLLETSWEALEHAGIAPSSLAGTSTGVYVGICNADYGQIALNASREEITPHLATGLSHAVAAGRISYVLGLQGPSMAVDTSCSASLVAVHLACQSLRMSECNLALAGGVNLVLNPEITIALSQSRMMAPDGRCKAFSELANGFVRGEGCGMIVLERLPDAIRDRHQIFAVIRGSACNQDGRSSGLTAPNGPSQEAVIAAALKDAGMKPDDLGYIEAHGTGTALGDPIELGAINSIFSGRSASSGPLLVGSVKTNLGHLESAAGIAGLIKLVLSIRHGEIPASLHFSAPNPRVEWDRVPLHIPTAAQSWRGGQKKRAGGVSSFGFSGTNAHVIVEEYAVNADAASAGPETQADPTEITTRPLLFALSAKSDSALKAIAARLAADLSMNPLLSLAGIARTLNIGRSHFEHRAAFVTTSCEELIERLNAFAKDDARGTPYVGRVLGHAPRAAFVFCDESNFGANFAQDLYESVPIFRESLLQCEEILLGELGRPLTSLLYPSASRDECANKLPSSWKYPAAFAIQFAFAELWRRCGIEPAIVYGFGIGEIVAGCVAGVFSLADGLRLAAARGNGDVAAYEKCVRSIAYSTPHSPMILNRSGPQADSAEYWAACEDNGPHAPAIAALDRENCAALVSMAQSTALKLIQSETADAGKWLMPAKRSTSASFDFVNTVAVLYVRGFSPDMSTFYDHVPATAVSLPTYPFERERYWIANSTDSKRDRQGDAQRAELNDQLPGNAGAATGDWMYDLIWEPKPLDAATSETKLQQNDLDETDSATPATNDLTRIAELNLAAAPIYAAYILQALCECGLDPLPRARFTEQELATQLKIAPNRRRILGRLLGILVEDGVLEKLGESFRFIDFHPRPDAERQLDLLTTQYPECRTELHILRRCGKKLSAVLQGAYDPMQLVFADGSIDEAEQIYEKSSVCRFFNSEAAKQICMVVERINQKESRPARILEIGAGTGATTVSVITALYNHNFEYCFTDISPVFLARARTKFSHVPSMTYRLLDVENDPGAQNFAAGEYDVVLAANVLHATADLQRTIRHAAKMLAPDGTVLLVEGVRPDRWLDLTFGLTDGWWRSVDLGLRPQHPLISADSWTAILKDAGIGSTRTISYALKDGSKSQQVVIVGRADAAKPAKGRALSFPREWLIFADRLGIGAALGKSLENAGERCRIISRSKSSSEISCLNMEPGGTSLQIVYLWGIDIPETIESIKTLSEGSEIGGKSLIQMIQSVLKCGRDSDCITIVTRGAQAPEAFSPSLGGAVQSLGWGVGRVLSLEMPAQFGALIDIDPTLSPEGSADILMAELLDGDREDQVAYRRNQRLVPRLKRTNLLKEAGGVAPVAGLRDGGSYLITGGLGGLGLQVARWAAESGAKHLVLLARRGIRRGDDALAAERRSEIQRIEDLGARVAVIEGDVASQEDVRSLFAKFGKDFPPLCGVFHAALDWSAAALANLTCEQIDRTFAAKVRGTWLLHEATKDLTLDFFLAFSSAASVLGAKGMAHYAAGNQFVDSFAHFRRAMGLPMLAVNWGTWDVMRMVSREEQIRLKNAGIVPMQSAKVLELFPYLIASRRAQWMIAQIDWTAADLRLHHERALPLLEHFNRAEAPVNVGPPSAAPSSALETGSLHRAVTMPAANRTKFISTFVLEQAAQVLGFRRGELPPDDVRLTDLGLDSLMAVDLKNRLQRGIGQELSPTVVFDYPTVNAISNMLDTMLWAARDSFESGASIPQKDEIRI
jgi:acyl transferase domain-containing protein/SAM-dependent methyltransferase/acyl carrier protein/NADP-dependent 3-hydroxy acid dehydrogenase YdfG